MRKLAALALALVFLPGFGPSAQTSLPSIERQVEQLRGLRFKKAVEAQLEDTAGLQKVLRSEIAVEYPEGEWPKMENTLKVFNLIPPKMDLRRVMTSLLEEQVAGLYNPRSQKLYVNAHPIEGEEMLGELGLQDLKLQDVFIAHELDHALTDQYFKLLSLPLEDKDNEDRASAARCVVEGDATWVMLRYMYQVLKVPPDQQEQMGNLMATMGLGKELMGESVPEYLQENLLMSYLGGLALVKAAYDRSGFDGVNALYTKPPASMKLVLHPEKYFAGKDAPVKVQAAAPKGWGQAGWNEYTRGVWGELNARIILQEWGCDEAMAEQAAEGWGGDTYVVFKGPAGFELVWVSEWDTEKDAIEFFAAAEGTKDVRVAREGRRVTVTKGGPLPSEATSPKAQEPTKNRN